VEIQIMVNGTDHTMETDVTTTLLGFLRDRLDLTGTKECCDLGECGACTVLVDGRPVNSCLVLAVELAGCDITTIEGLAVDGRLSPLQATFLTQGAVQCGFCTPGQVMAAHALLERNPHPTRSEVDEALSGNLCRCGCYAQIRKAVLVASEARR
jgi:carbon-monoxide dehydrogenase small subunit